MAIVFAIALTLPFAVNAAGPASQAPPGFQHIRDHIRAQQAALQAPCWTNDYTVQIAQEWTPQRFGLLREYCDSDNGHIRQTYGDVCLTVDDAMSIQQRGVPPMDENFPEAFVVIHANLHTYQRDPAGNWFNNLVEFVKNQYGSQVSNLLNQYCTTYVYLTRCNECHAINVAYFKLHG